MIKIVGMGVIDGDLSIRGAVAIDDADIIIVKTAKTATYPFFAEYKHITCDAIYDKAADFSELDSLIAAFVMSHKNKKVVFCVDGSGVDDRAVMVLRQLTEVEIICGVSRETLAIKESPTTQHVAMSAYDLVNNEQFNYDSEQTLIIKDIDNNLIAAQVKEVLSRVVGEETVVKIMCQSEVVDMPLYELDRDRVFDYSSQLLVPPQDMLTKSRYSYMDLMKIMAVLRGDNGCQWDREQDHKSIRHNLIEEAYELVEAINNDDVDNIIEEAGDVLLQAVFHTVIGDDEGNFEGHEVLDTLCRKLITRHTHIFGSTKASNATEALAAWDSAKAKEKGYARVSSKMDSLPRVLPATLRSNKAQKIVAKWGMDFAKIDDVEYKVLEELREFIKASDKEDEGGDLLFSVVNLLRFANIDSEVALNRATEKFINRFKYIESKLGDKSGKDCSTDELDRLWVEAKNNTK